MHNVKLAIMQPYFFPYIGYWQLINAVDRFVIYDDVNYISRGWVNRNRILINGAATYITIPLEHASEFKKICDTRLQGTQAWRGKLVRMVENTYRRAPYFTEVFPVIETLIWYDTSSLSEYLSNQICTLSTFMGIETEVVRTSRCYDNNELNGQERILDICKREGATTYINPQGGRNLYDPLLFNDAGVELQFITMCPLEYRQRSAGFVPSLSIIDVLMEVGVRKIQRYLNVFDLISNEAVHER